MGFLCDSRLWKTGNFLKSKMADSEEHSRLIAEFSDVTGADTERARFFLESSGWQLHIALSSFFEDGDLPSPPHNPPQAESMPAQPEASHPTRVSPRFASIATFQGHHDTDSDEDQGQAFYAGGSEHSGQQILGPPRKKQNADDITQNIFEEAKRHGAEEVSDEPGPSQPCPQVFRGAGYRLGDTEGGVARPQPGTVPMTQDQPSQDTEVALRFWSNGFSVDDGELRSFDDPENEDFLASVKKGEIPRELLRLSRGGEVHVNLEDHRHEEYVPQKKKMTAFAGEGRKLGSPVPEVKFNEEKKRATAAANQAPKPFNIDQSQPTTSIQIRLADGTRMVSKFNHTHTVADIRGFITAPFISAIMQTSARSWVLEDIWVC
ncbi:NSFL1 cofactor p47 isoform X2 [Nematostella vectensis]|uniref:NSFL1 cofactor p47 isoform X2 n=1 Tax=Nematostella vectensis TaxID=45351 RepID=UPI002076D675|nr:NSFL1 cofactor p47 isoform X2 [Nematostella vectensis]